MMHMSPYIMLMLKGTMDNKDARELFQITYLVGKWNQGKLLHSCSQKVAEVILTLYKYDNAIHERASLHDSQQSIHRTCGQQTHG